MYTSTIIAGLVAAASFVSANPIEERTAKYQGPQGKGDFALEVIATCGDLSLSGQFLTTLHAGAGLNALTVEPAQGRALKLHFDTATGKLTQKNANAVFTLGLADQKTTTDPKGYYFAGFDILPSNNHFHFSGPDNFLQFGPSYKGDIWSICPQVVEGGPSDILAVRPASTKRNPKCTDIKLKAIF